LFYNGKDVFVRNLVCKSELIGCLIDVAKEQSVQIGLVQSDQAKRSSEAIRSINDNSSGEMTEKGFEVLIAVQIIQIAFDVCNNLSRFVE
jgi:hypothetical protein